MKNKTVGQYTIFLLLLMIAALPPLVYTLTGAQTLSIGMMLCSLTIIIVCRKQAKKLIKPKKRILYIAFTILIYTLIQHLLIGPWNTKAYLSIPIIAIVVISAYLAATNLLTINQESFKKAIYKIYYTCCIVVTFNILTQYTLGSILGYTHPKSIFPFLEPSHFATFFGIFFLIFFVSNSSNSPRLLALIFTVSIAALIPNTTLLAYVGIALIILIASSKQQKILISIPVICISAITIFNIVITDSYFTDRLNFSSDNTNTSALVYMQGLDDTKNSLSLTSGLGLGFQMLGTQPPSVYALSISKSMGNSSGELNRSDGGFFAAKIISEFGILGLTFVIYLLLLIAKSFTEIKKILHNKNQTINNFSKLSAYTVVISFTVEVFVRGTGYFSPGLYIFIVSILFLLLSPRNKKQ